MTASQVDKLEHALGLDYPEKIKKGVTWRNFYCAEVGDLDMLALVGAGLMAPGMVINNGRDQYFHATRAGMDAVGIREVST